MFRSISLLFLFLAGFLTGVLYASYNPEGLLLTVPTRALQYTILAASVLSGLFYLAHKRQGMPESRVVTL